jgi:hypothetical protein
MLFFRAEQSSFPAMSRPPRGSLSWPSAVFERSTHAIQAGFTADCRETSCYLQAHVTTLICALLLLLLECALGRNDRDGVHVLHTLVSQSHILQHMACWSSSFHQTRVLLLRPARLPCPITSSRSASHSVRTTTRGGCCCCPGLALLQQW